MSRKPLLVSFLLSALLAVEALGQMPNLPEGAQTKWVVDKPEEVVGYLTFDPATVADRLPSLLRFITVEELAAGQIPWAKEHLEECPGHAGWGISFIEIVRTRTFQIDGCSPSWAKHGAAALWCARVAPSDSVSEPGPGKPFLMLEFWMPDSLFVAYMLEKGHYASYGNVSLQENPAGRWSGSIEVDGLCVVCNCTRVRNVERAGSAGMQVFFPPALSRVTSIVRVAFAGHQECACKEDVSWRFKGVHPLVRAVMLGPSALEFGYDMRGGAYRP
jgi:hypothetical protein